MENFHILYHSSIESFVRREVVWEKVPKDTVCDSLNVTPTANRLLHQFPKLFAQVFLAQQHQREEIEKEQRRQ